MGADRPKDEKENVVLFAPRRSAEVQASEIFGHGDVKEGLRAFKALMRVKDPAARLMLIELMEKFAANQPQGRSE